MNNWCTKFGWGLMGYLFAVGALADCDFSDFPTMPEMKISILMDDASYNNKPMKLRSFSAGTSASNLVRYYKREWKDRFSESAFEPWQQISTLEGECLFTVQYGEAGDGSFGRLLISPPPDASGGMALGEGVVKPGDALVVSDLKTKDGRKDGRVTIITSERSVSELINFYHTEMTVDGWSLEQNFTEYGRAVMVFRRGVDEANVLITPAGDATQILVNEVEN